MQSYKYLAGAGLKKFWSQDINQMFTLHKIHNQAFHNSKFKEQNSKFGTFHTYSLIAISKKNMSENFRLLFSFTLLK